MTMEIKSISIRTASIINSLKDIGATFVCKRGNDFIFHVNVKGRSEEVNNLFSNRSIYGGQGIYKYVNKLSNVHSAQEDVTDFQLDLAENSKFKEFLSKKKEIRLSSKSLSLSNSDFDVSGRNFFSLSTSSNKVHEEKDNFCMAMEYILELLKSKLNDRSIQELQGGNERVNEEVEQIRRSRTGSQSVQSKVSHSLNGTPVGEEETRFQYWISDLKRFGYLPTRAGESPEVSGVGEVAVSPLDLAKYFCDSFIPVYGVSGGKNYMFTGRNVHSSIYSSLITSASSYEENDERIVVLFSKRNLESDGTISLKSRSMAFVNEEERQRYYNVNIYSFGALSSRAYPNSERSYLSIEEKDCIDECVKKSFSNYRKKWDAYDMFMDMYKDWCELEDAEDFDSLINSLVEIANFFGVTGEDLDKTILEKGAQETIKYFSEMYSDHLINWMDSLSDTILFEKSKEESFYEMVEDQRSLRLSDLKGQLSKLLKINDSNNLLRGYHQEKVFELLLNWGGQIKPVSIISSLERSTPSNKFLRDLCAIMADIQLLSMRD